MRIFAFRPAAAAAVLVVAAAMMAGALALKPAIASDGTVTVQVGPFTLVTCNHPSPNPCQQYKNLGTGIGVEGDAANGTGVKGTSASLNGIGVAGFSNKGRAVMGTSNSSGQGVVGFSNSSDGVEGLSGSGYGVVGSSTNSLGVDGVSSNSDGVYAFSYNSNGLYADNGGAGGHAIEAHGFSSAASIYAYPHGNGPAGYFDGTNGNGFGVVAYTSGNTTFWGNNSNPSGYGTDITGAYIALVGRAPAGTGTYPLVLTDSSSADVFYVNGNGDVFYHGTLNTFLRTHNGGSTTGFGTASTTPTVDDNGTAQLINGAAFVALDPAFEQTIDTSKAYHVMLTPDGDTRGLFVASKSPTGFVVREVQGGRNSISFDYHIYATALGRANDRMTLNRLPTMPKVPIVVPAPEKPSKAPIHVR